MQWRLPLSQVPLSQAPLSQVPLSPVPLIPVLLVEVAAVVRKLAPVLVLLQPMQLRLVPPIPP